MINGTSIVGKGFRSQRYLGGPVMTMVGTAVSHQVAPTSCHWKGAAAETGGADLDADDHWPSSGTECTEREGQSSYL